MLYVIMMMISCFEIIMMEYSNYGMGCMERFLDIS